jgi:PadR family transcriptional regulator PadR
MTSIHNTNTHAPTPADSEILVLALLAKGPMYGYALARHAAAASGNQLRLSPGVLYPLLAGLEQRGLLTSLWEVIRADRSEPGDAGASAAAVEPREPPRGRRRKWYRLTPRGSEHLESRIAAHRAYVTLIDRFLGRAAQGGSRSA